MMLNGTFYTYLLFNNPLVYKTLLELISTFKFPPTFHQIFYQYFNLCMIS